jgi:hypothetical protein
VDLMSWKEKLNKEHYIFNKEVDEYLLSHGFYYDKMSPRFMNDESHWESIKEHNKPCLRLDMEDPDNKGYTIRVFINRLETYKEVENSWRSFESSNHIGYQASYFDIELIDRMLDELLK